MSLRPLYAFIAYTLHDVVLPEDGLVSAETCSVGNNTHILLYMCIITYLLNYLLTYSMVQSPS